MATQDQIFNVRLRINDPFGNPDKFISFEEVAALPATPSPQTCYFLTTDSNYYATLQTTGVTPDDYDLQVLMVSDASINLWINDGGEDSATCKGIKSIMSQLGYKLGVQKTSTGQDSTEFTTLKDLYDYYKGLLALCTEEKKSNDGNNSGRYLGSASVEIAGGNL